jgi:dsRNA-specific ribonuclease
MEREMKDLLRLKIQPVKTKGQVWYQQNILDTPEWKQTTSEVKREHRKLKENIHFAKFVVIGYPLSRTI